MNETHTMDREVRPMGEKRQVSVTTHEVNELAGAGDQHEKAVESIGGKSEPPYILRRKTVKEGREPVQFYFREEFFEGERELEQRVEDILDTDVSTLDLREAAYAVAQTHPEEVAALLREWGYEYR